MEIHTAKQSINKVLLSNFALSIVSWVKNQGSFYLYSQFYVQVLSSQPRAPLEPFRLLCIMFLFPHLMLHFYAPFFSLKLSVAPHKVVKMLEKCLSQRGFNQF